MTAGAVVQVVHCGSLTPVINGRRRGVPPAGGWLPRGMSQAGGPPSGVKWRELGEGRMLLLQHSWREGWRVSLREGGREGKAA